MENFSILSLGGACRPAFQLKRTFSENFLSGPFDWTVTPITSLNNFFDPMFDFENVLAPSNIIFEGLGIVDKYTGIQFHHGLGPPDIEKYRKGIYLHSPSPSSLLLAGPELAQVKERFIYTGTRLLHLLSQVDHIILVRWIGAGTNSKFANVPHAYTTSSDDSLLNLSSLVARRFPRANISLMYVMSVYDDCLDDQESRLAFVDSYTNDNGHPSLGMTSELHCPRLAQVSIKENRPTTYRGDNLSWDCVCSEVKRLFLS